MRNVFSYEDSTYHKNRHPELIEDQELRLAWAHFANLAYFSHVKSTDTILEFGAGLGNNLLVVKNKVKNVIAVEPSSIGRRISSSDRIQTFSSFEEIGDRRFDTILCRHVLEHLENPLETLKEFNRRLNSNGRLVLVVPRERQTQMPKENDINQHLFNWTPRNLCNLLNRADFQDHEVRWETFGAKRKLLFVYRKFGGELYARMVRLAGRIFRFRELVVESRPKKHDAK